MVLVVSILALLSLGVGVYGLVSPAGMKSLVSRFRSLTGFWTAVVLRLVLGVALWRVAAASRTPGVLQGLGVVSAAASLALVLLGFSRYLTLVSWWSRQSDLQVRAWSLVSVALGAFLLWSIQ